jgi:hypothetical protein
MRARSSVVGLTFAWLAASFAVGRLGAADDPTGAPLPDAGEVIRRFVEQAGALATNQVADSYIYYRTNITEEFNRKGRLDEREVLLLRVTVVDGDKDVELLQIDGREPTDRERERELKRFASREGGVTRRERPDRSRQMEAYLTMEVLGRYVFEVTGREAIEGRTCLRVAFKPGVSESDSDKMFERVLDRIEGSFWIDETDYQLARADIRLGDKVSLWGGLLGVLEQLRLKIDRARDATTGEWRDQIVDAHFVGRAVTKHLNVRTIDHSSPPQPLNVAPVVAAD